MNRKTFNLILIIAGAVFAVLAVVLFIVGIVYDGDHAFTKVMLIIVSVLSLALAVELAYLWWISNDKNPNYFLYDSRTKRNVPVEKLSFQVVSGRMNKYFSNFAPSEGKIWTDKILDDPNLDIGEEFKPLVAYKLLYDLAAMDVEKGWKCFEVASVETVEYICRGLEKNGDKEVANNLRMMKTAQPFQIKYVRDYLISNKGYLQAKMFKYVRANIEKFQ